jgi:hypothetical protein
MPGTAAGEAAGRQTWSGGDPFSVLVALRNRDDREILLAQEQERRSPALVSLRNGRREDDARESTPPPRFLSGC